MPSNTWSELMGQAETAGQAVPDGTYDVVVESAKKAMSSNNKPMVVAVFKIINGPHAGMSVWNNFVISEGNPNALGFFFEHMATLGATSDFFAQIPPPPEGLDYVANKIVGQHATIIVSTREWRNTIRNQVDAIKPFLGVVTQAPEAPAPAPAPVTVATQPPVAVPGPVPQVPVPAAVPVVPVLVPGSVPSVTPGPVQPSVTVPAQVAVPPAAPAPVQAPVASPAIPTPAPEPAQAPVPTSPAVPGAQVPEVPKPPAAPGIPEPPF